MPSLTTLLTITLALSLSQEGTGMYFVPRSDWNATPPRGSYTPITNPKGVKVHYLGPSFAGTAHSQCDEFMKSIQDSHLSNTAEGYMDIAYNLGVCQHGYVYEGRGKGHRSGANGDAQLNAEHYAVLAFLGKAGVNKPSGDQVIGIQDAIAYLRRAGAGNEIRGHRDGYNTECPGEALYGLVTGGGLEPGEELWDGGEHVVKQGETLEDLEREYNVPKRYIVHVNGLEEPYELKAGERLTIPARGVPLSNPADGGDDGDDGDAGSGYEPFPGAEWFKSEPNSPIIEAMGKRLVEEGCNNYQIGPGPRWTDADLAAYQCWQQKLGYTGADADGWPGQVSWDKLKVPNV